MDIKLKTVKVSELVEGCVDRQEEGVRGYGGKLNICSRVSNRNGYEH